MGVQRENVFLCLYAADGQCMKSGKHGLHIQCDELAEFQRLNFFTNVEHHFLSVAWDVTEQIATEPFATEHRNKISILQLIIGATFKVCPNSNSIFNHLLIIYVEHFTEVMPFYYVLF